MEVGMSHAINRRTGVFAAVAIVATAGAALAQGYLNYPASNPPSNAPLKIRIMLTDGQTIEMSCASVEVAFAAGGELRVTENGALPISTIAPPTGRAEQKPLPPVYEEAATFELHERGVGTPFVPRLPGTPPTSQVHGILGPPELYGTTIPAPGTEPNDEPPTEPVSPPFEDAQERR